MMTGMLRTLMGKNICIPLVKPNGHGSQRDQNYKKELKFYILKYGNRNEESWGT